jgi:outer membrane biosynthesis protein TonB
LQPHPNNDLRRIPSEKKKGIAGTIIIGSVLLFMLVVVAFRLPEPPENEEGILVNFGTDETGFGMIEPSPPPVQEEASVPQPAPADEVQKEKELLTQNNEEAPEVKKVDPEVERKRLEKIEADRKLKEQLEAERKKKVAEDAERKRIEAEQKRQADIMNKTRDALANSKNAGTTSKSEGEAGGTGNQGVPTGSVDSKNRGDGSGLGNQGISYDLGGRNVQSLPKPNYDYQEGGKVVVEVSVDRSGKVIQARPGFTGSTTLDDYLLKVAREAALKARFEAKSDAPAVQKGTITYNFVLR